MAVVLPDPGDVRDGIGYGEDGTEFTGTLTLPAVGDVRDGETYGADGTEFEGTLLVDTEPSEPVGTGGLIDSAAVLRAWMLAKAAIVAEVGARVYVEELPEGIGWDTPDLVEPTILLVTTGGSADPESPVVRAQIDCLCLESTKGRGAALAGVVSDALDAGFDGRNGVDVGAVRVCTVEVDSAIDYGRMNGTEYNFALLSLSTLMIGS